MKEVTVDANSIVTAEVLPEVLPDRTLLLPLVRLVLRLNKLEGGRLKSERDPCEREVGPAERSDPAGPSRSSQSGSAMDTTAACGAFSLS